MTTRQVSKTKQQIMQNQLCHIMQLVFSAGEMAELDKIKLDIQIVGFRGDYYNVINDGKQKIKGLIYPVPDINLPFLGVHLTKMYDGQIEAGPNAVFSFKRRDIKLLALVLKTQ